MVPVAQGHHASLHVLPFAVGAFYCYTGLPGWVHLASGCTPDTRPRPCPSWTRRGLFPFDSTFCGTFSGGSYGRGRPGGAFPAHPRPLPCTVRPAPLVLGPADARLVGRLLVFRGPPGSRRHVSRLRGPVDGGRRRHRHPPRRQAAQKGQ